MKINKAKHLSLQLGKQYNGNYMDCTFPISHSPTGQRLFWFWCDLEWAHWVLVMKFMKRSYWGLTHLFEFYKDNEMMMRMINHLSRTWFSSCHKLQKPTMGGGVIVNVPSLQQNSNTPDTELPLFVHHSSNLFICMGKYMWLVAFSEVHSLGLVYMEVREDILFQECDVLLTF